jgi:hypothetical protein
METGGKTILKKGTKNGIYEISIYCCRVKGS